MQNKYIFRKAQPEEVDAVIALIKERMHWMDEKNLDSWNRIDYLGLFGKDYFQDNLENIWVAEEDGQLAAAMVALLIDDRWEDQKEAVYVHNFVASVNHRGAGNALLDFAEELAKEWKVDRIRLDSARSNKKLEEYYTARGFEPRGSYTMEETYDGVLREKLL